MKRFADLGIAQDDGKMYDCRSVSVAEIVNSEIEVIDFALGVTTKYGDGRAVVHFRHASTGEDGKFFTACRCLLRALGQVHEADLPFLTTIKCNKYGRARRYYFC